MPGDMRMALDTVTPDSVKRRLRLEYVKIKNEPPSRTLEGMIGLLSHFQKPRLLIPDLMQDTVAYIQKSFRLRWVMIGLRTPADDLYRYEYQIGMRDEAWQRQRSRTYKRTEFDVCDRYKFGDISRLTRAYLEEDNPLFGTDEQVANRPALLRIKRRADDETLEADFIDTLILGPNDMLLGWIEYSGLLMGKFPDAMVMRHIEVVASILGAALTTQGYAKEHGRP